MILFKRKGSKIKTFLKDKAKRHLLIKYFSVIIILFAYFIYSEYKFGTKNGLIVTFLTWSFFVFCTPIADAGILIDFPVRMITKMRMIHSEILVWTTATLLNISIFFINPSIYNKTVLLQFLHKILTHPYPLWGIIILSAIGTFFSITFGDELIDVSKHKDRVKYQKHITKYKLIIFLSIIAITIIAYQFLLKDLGLHFPLI